MTAPGSSRRSTRVITYVDAVEDYQQVAAIARAEDIAVLNAGYACCDRRALGAAGARAGRHAEPEHLADRFTDPAADDEALFAPLLDVARTVLGRGRGPCPSCARSARRRCAVLLVERDAHRERSRASRRLVDGGVGRRPRHHRPAGMPCRGSSSTSSTRACGGSPRSATPGCSGSPSRRCTRTPSSPGRHPLTPFDSALVAQALPALIDRAVEGGPS